jgi:hypothetical protein
LLELDAGKMRHPHSGGAIAGGNHCRQTNAERSQSSKLSNLSLFDDNLADPNHANQTAYHRERRKFLAQHRRAPAIRASTSKVGPAIRYETAQLIIV